MNNNVKTFNEENEGLDKNNIPYSNFIIKEIEKDGNCFYRTISYYIGIDKRTMQKLITSYILNNPDDYIFSVADEDINNAEELDQESLYQKKKIYNKLRKNSF